MDAARRQLISVRKLHLFPSAPYLRGWQGILPPGDELPELYLIWHEVKQFQFENINTSEWATKYLGFVEINQILLWNLPPKIYNIHLKSFIQQASIEYW